MVQAGDVCKFIMDFVEVNGWATKLKSATGWYVIWESHPRGYFGFSFVKDCLLYRTPPSRLSYDITDK